MSNDLLDQARKRTNDVQAKHRTKDSAWYDMEHFVMLYEKDREENPDDDKEKEKANGSCS